MKSSNLNIQPTGETILTETIALPQTNYRQYIRACSLSREIRDMGNTYINIELSKGNKRPNYGALCRWYRSDEMSSYYSK